MKETKAFSPGHITGIFQICDQVPNLLQKGSRGAGVSINKGVKTKVIVKPSTKSSFKIRINKIQVKTAKVSEHVLNSFLSRVKGNHEIFVDHDISIPIGSGFGTSGAGALSLAIALNEALSLDLPQIEVAQIAHIAEVKCKTGLGTVIAEKFGQN